MWYAIIGIVAFFFGSLLGCLSVGFFFWAGRQDEEHAASVRIVDAREKISKANTIGAFLILMVGYVNDLYGLRRWHIVIGQLIAILTVSSPTPKAYGFRLDSLSKQPAFCQPVP